MTAENAMKVKLMGGPEHTSSYVTVSPDGTLVVECYDFSDEAERFFGNDVGFVLVIEPAEKNKVITILQTESKHDSLNSDPDLALLDLMAQTFSSYFAIKVWLEEKRIAFSSQFIPWA